jgi:hypothetical protein
MMEAVRTSETSVDNQFTRQYNPEDSSEHHTRRRENLKYHEIIAVYSENHAEPINIKRKGYLMLKRLINIATIQL